MKCLAIANQKGGVGKTTTALNVGAVLAGSGLRVMLIDLDPQGSLTLATVGDCAGRSMAEVFGGSQPGKLSLVDIAQEIGPGLHLAPADIALSVAEMDINSRRGREFILKKALSTLTGYDLALLDCGPNLGLLVVNALTAADGVLCPTLPTALDLRGLRLFLSSVEAIRADLNPALEFLGVVVCQLENRKLHRAALEDLEAGGLPILATIGRSVQAADSSGRGQPIGAGTLADQYQNLSVEVQRWLKRKS